MPSERNSPSLTAPENSKPSPTKADTKSAPSPSPQNGIHPPLQPRRTQSRRLRRRTRNRHHRLHHRTEFTLPYSPGELKAVAYEGGHEIGTIAFTTAGRPHSLSLTPDRTRVRSSRDDLSYIMITVVDEKGHPVPDAVVPVSFAVSGAGEIAAVGNANPREMASFRQPHRNTFHG